MFRFILLVAVISAPAGAQTLSCPDGALLADIDRDGKVVGGAMNTLREHYRRGGVLRVGWELDWNEDGDTDITHWATPAFLSELAGQLYAQIPAIEAQRPDAATARIGFGEESRSWHGLLGTDGTLTGRYDDGAARSSRVRGLWCALGRTLQACASAWRLAYHHDADGQRIAGSRQGLLDAIRHAYPLRMTWGTRSASDETISVAHVAEPLFVTVTGGEVFAQLPEHLAQKSYVGTDAGSFGKASVMWRGLLGTTGSFDAVWTDRASGEEVRRLPQRAAIAWHVYAPSCGAGSAPEMAVPGGVRLDER